MHICIKLIFMTRLVIAEIDHSKISSKVHDLKILFNPYYVHPCCNRFCMKIYMQKKPPMPLVDQKREDIYKFIQTYVNKLKP